MSEEIVVEAPGVEVLVEDPAVEILVETPVAEVVVEDTSPEVVLENIFDEVVIEHTGIPGPPGPPGPPGEGGFYRFVQSTPSAAWYVDGETHALGHKPLVMVVVGNRVVFADVSYAADDADHSVTVEFAEPQVGQLFLV